MDWRLRGAMGSGGFTLLELIVVVALVSVIATISALALGPFLAQESPPSWRVRLSEARRHAVNAGEPSGALPDSTAPSPVLFLPDGRAVGEGVDPLTGRDLP